jgi:hypothetical protein
MGEAASAAALPNAADKKVSVEKTSMRPVFVAWLLLSTLTQVPYLQAWFLPPRGTSFVGFFYYVDDQYNYLSYVEQAERGAFLFENKLVLEPHTPSLVNLEWWLVGRLSAVLGGRPFFAYRLVATLATFAILAGLDRWLRRGGLPLSHRFPALLLVSLAGGLGAGAWRIGLVPLHDALDLTTGVFPFVESLANPHFALGTALLVWSLWCLTTARSRGQVALGLALGTVVGLVRPYDLFTLGIARCVGLLVAEPRRDWAPRLLPLLGLAPVAAYDAWVFFGLPWYGSFGLSYVPPRAATLGLALGPAVALACLAANKSSVDPDERRTRAHLASWAAVALAIVAFQPVGFASQFLVGAGAPLLALGALGLGRFPRHFTFLAVGLLSPTAALALGLTMAPNPRWYVPVEIVAAVETLKPLCRPGEILMAPADIGLLAIGRTACKSYVAHPAAPNHGARAARVQRFYAEEPPLRRAALLDELGIDHLVLPGAPGRSAEAWLGANSAFEHAITLGTTRQISIYNRHR